MAELTFEQCPYYNGKVEMCYWDIPCRCKALDDERCDILEEWKREREAEDSPAWLAR